MQEYLKNLTTIEFMRKEDNKKFQVFLTTSNLGQVFVLSEKNCEFHNSVEMIINIFLYIDRERLQCFLQGSKRDYVRLI